MASARSEIIVLSAPFRWEADGVRFTLLQGHRMFHNTSGNIQDSMIFSGRRALVSALSDGWLRLGTLAAPPGADVKEILRALTATTYQYLADEDGPPYQLAVGPVGRLCLAAACAHLAQDTEMHSAFVREFWRQRREQHVCHNLCAAARHYVDDCHAGVAAGRLKPDVAQAQINEVIHLLAVTGVRMLAALANDLAMREVTRRMPLAAAPAPSERPRQSVRL